MLGLAGSPHCIGMCGGIAGMLANTTSTPTRSHTGESGRNGYIPVAERSHQLRSSKRASRHILLILFQLGRIFSYAIIGALVGGFVGGLVTASSFAVEDSRWITLSLRMLASLVLVAIALSLVVEGGISQKLEKFGSRLWTNVQPLTKPLIPADSYTKAFLLGGLWGFIPCGLIYSALTWAALSGSAITSASLMFCFGLGTAPVLLGISSLAANQRLRLGSTRVRQLFALALVLLALAPWISGMSHQSKNERHNHSQHRSTERHYALIPLLTK